MIEHFHQENRLELFQHQVYTQYISRQRSHCDLQEYTISGKKTIANQDPHTVRSMTW
jgi:hypothetical protein